MAEPIKPKALTPGSCVRIIAPASPVDQARLLKGCEELARLNYHPRWNAAALGRDGYFAGPAAERLSDLRDALTDSSAHAVIAARGGYGSGYLLEGLDLGRAAPPRILLGHSDLTLPQVFLWRERRWVTFYGPMVAAGFEAGAGAAGGYVRESLLRAVSEVDSAWSLELQGVTLASGSAEGKLLGGCLTLVEAVLGTPWELDTRDAILLLEDRGMKPYQVDRALLHLKQAGKFAAVRGFLLGDFPDCDPPEPGGATVADVCRRLLGSLGVPVVFGAPVGHTRRAMLTVPLGIRARLEAAGAGRLTFLEPAVTR